MSFLAHLKRLRAATLSFALCGLPLGNACPGGSALIKSYGYVEIRPPSQLFAPGAMVVILHHSPLEAAFVCGPRGSLGTDLVVQRSRTMGQSLSKLNKQRIDMEAKFIESIRGDIRFRAVDRIVMEIDNARIEEVIDEDVLRGSRHRSDECHRALTNRIAQGFKPTMVSSALSGDMRFFIHWSASVDITAKAKIDTLSQLAIEMGGGVSSVTESEIRAKNLVFGIRTSSYMAELSMPQELVAGLMANGTERQSIDVRRHSRVYIDPVPDAPVVRSESYDPRRVGWTDGPHARVFDQPLPSLPEGAPIFAPRRPISRVSLARRNQALDGPSSSVSSEVSDLLRHTLRKALAETVSELDDEGVEERVERAMTGHLDELLGQAEEE